MNKLEEFLMTLIYLPSPYGAADEINSTLIRGRHAWFYNFAFAASSCAVSEAKYT